MKDSAIGWLVALVCKFWSVRPKADLFEQLVIVAGSSAALAKPSWQLYPPSQQLKLELHSATILWSLSNRTAEITQNSTHQSLSSVALRRKQDGDLMVLSTLDMKTAT